MAFLKNYAFFVFILFPCSLHVVHALNYATFSDGNGNFMLHWTYMDNKLVFNVTCKAMGWCAVGFTENPGGRFMVKYDIAAGGVDGNSTYLQDYWSEGTSPGPPRDTVNNFELVEATEMGEYTKVRFQRNLTTGEADKDVQFTMNTEVYIVWAMHSTNDADPTASNLSPQHTSRGRSANKQNLIAMAMAAGMTPTTTTMMMPSTSVVSTTQPTGAASMLESRVMFSAILAAIAVYLLS